MEHWSLYCYLGAASVAVQESSTFIGFIGVFILIVIAGIFITELLFKIFFKPHPLEKKIQDYLSRVGAYEAWWRKTQREFWLSLSGIAFEKELASLLNRVGYRATLTRQSGDDGVDVHLNRHGKEIIVQCKAHKKPVGIAAVRDLYGTLNHVNCDRAILASVSGFTKGVHEFINGKPIELMDLEDYIKIQKSLNE